MPRVIIMLAIFLLVALIIKLSGFNLRLDDDKLPNLIYLVVILSSAILFLLEKK